jgi:hypothetical protein
VALVGEDASARIDTDPAGARHVDLAPRMQARPGDVDAVAAREAGRETERAETDGQEPRELARRARLPGERRLEVDGGPSRVLAAELGGDRARDRVDAFDHVARRARETGEPLRESRSGLGRLQVRAELLRELWLVRERMRRRARFDQELERVHGRELRDERHLDVERRHRLGQVEAGEMVLERVAEPIQEVGLGANAERVCGDARERVRSRAQPQPVRRQLDASRETTDDPVGEGDAGAHACSRRRSSVHG